MKRKRKSILIGLASSILVSSLLLSNVLSASAQVSADETRWTKLIDDALMYQTTGEMDNALAYYQQALTEAENIDKNGPHVIVSLTQLSLLQEKMDKLKEAEASLRKAQTIASAMPGRDGKVWQSSVLYSLSNLLGKQNRTDAKAEVTAQRKAIDSSIEKDNSDFSGGFSRLQYSVRKNWHPPDNKVSRLVTVDWQTEKGGHFELVHTFISSGDAATDAAAVAAVRGLSDTSELPPTTLGPVSMRMDFKYNRFNKDGSKVPTPYSEKEDSVAATLKNLKEAEDSVGPNSPSLIALLLSMGHSYENAGKYTDAEKVTVRAKQIYEKTNQNDTVLLCSIYSLLGHVQVSNHDLDHAAESFKAALSATGNSQASDIVSARAQVLNDYASLLFQLGKKEESRKMYQEAKQIR